MSEQNKATQTATALLTKNLDRRLLASLESCVRCGVCAETCHYYMADPRPEHVPAYRGEVLRRLYRGFHDPLRKLFPGLVGAAKLDESGLDKLSELAFGTCTLCRRCTVNCPMGVDNVLLVRALRTIVTAGGREPEILSQLADAAIAREENLDLIKDLFLEQIGELEGEVREKLADPQARIPVEEAGADVLYVALSGAHTILPAAILFNLTATSWTLSLYEAANYGVFLADAARAKRITQRVVAEAKRLGVKEVVVSECGHAYATLRWEAPNWFDEPFPFRVRSLIEVMAEWVLQGKLALDPRRNPRPVTYHDSCNLARNGGLLEEPRVVLRAAVQDFREMTPNRQQAICCGGGGGIVANPDMEEKRLRAGKPKANQIRQTGAEIVAASCDNCKLQLNDLSTRYELGTEVVGLADLVVNALVLAPAQPATAAGDVPLVVARCDHPVEALSELAG